MHACWGQQQTKSNTIFFNQSINYFTGHSAQHGHLRLRVAGVERVLGIGASLARHSANDRPTVQRPLRLALSPLNDSVILIDCFSCNSHSTFPYYMTDGFMIHWFCVALLCCNHWHSSAIPRDPTQMSWLTGWPLPFICTCFVFPPPNHYTPVTLCGSLFAIKLRLTCASCLFNLKLLTDSKLLMHKEAFNRIFLYF